MRSFNGVVGGTDGFVQFNDKNSLSGFSTASGITISSDGRLEVSKDTTGGVPLQGDIRLPKTFSVYAKSNFPDAYKPNGNVGVMTMYSGNNGDLLVIGSDGTANSDNFYTNMISSVSIQSVDFSAISSFGHSSNSSDFAMASAFSSLSNNGGADTVSSLGTFVGPNILFGSSDLTTSAPIDPFNAGRGYLALQKRLANATGNPPTDITYLYVDETTNHLKQQLSSGAIYNLTASAGGSNGNIQFNNGGFLGGTSKLTKLSSTELLHLGAPLHQETASIFRDSGETTTTIPNIGESRSMWSSKSTTNATPISLLVVSVPVSGWNDAQITISCRVTVSSPGGGGVMAHEVVCQRNGGTLTIVHDENVTITAGLTIATAIAANIDDNGTISIRGTGIASTNINWITSAHIQITREPS